MPVTTKQVEKKVPVAALRFAAEVEIGTNGEGAKTAPVKLFARSADPVNHWWYGRIVHDMAGMSLAKDRLPIDYCHNVDEIMGYVNQFDTASGALVASGALTPFKDGDRASEVLFKSGQGVPYEASIFFDYESLVLESVPQGMSVQVNGKTFDGPGCVARQWTLRGIAICPYGQDANTAAQFSSSKDCGPEVAVKFTENEVTPEEKDEEEKLEEQTEEKPADTEVEEKKDETEELAETDEVVDADEQEEDESETTPKKSVESATELSKQGKRFLEAFGDQGGVWFAQGKTFAQAQALFNKSILDENKSLREKNAELSTKLSARRGEKDPVSFSEGPEEKVTQRHANLGPNLSRFASRVKFVGKK